MKNQKDINHKMRSILIDWLVEVSNKFKLQPQTLWLCVNILDRYLEQVQTNRSKLQLVGVTALLIACKYEEIYPPEVKDCVYITDYAYDRAEVLQMEATILTQLEYKMSIPTGYHFLIRYLNSIQASERTRHLANYYAERNLQESDMLLVRPHKFAAAALYAALKQQNDQYPVLLRKTTIWNKFLQEESGLTEKDLRETAKTIIKHVGEEPETASKRRLVATKKKYSTDKFAGISNLPLPTI
jgi:cyclin B